MPTNQELEKICNVAGYPIYPWAAEQLRKRSELGSEPTRSDDNLTYLANKGAWVRVISSVNLEEKLKSYFSTTYQLSLPNERSLAENFILYGGTSTYASNLNSTTQGMILRSGLDAYNLTGNQEIQDYGYRPIPGITSVTIDAMGRMGSLRQATINFKVWDKYQLDIMDALYFRLGFTTLIEWGHAKYYDNQGRIQSSEQFMINPFSGNLTKEDIGIKISTNVRQSYGNYGGMLGIITSFNFNMTQDGGYDCTVKAMSLGSVLGNYAITQKSSLANVYFEQLKQYLNNQISNEKSAVLKEIEDAKLKAIQEAQAKIQSDGSNWAKLNITDRLSNILFNTNSKPPGDFPVFTEFNTTTSNVSSTPSTIVGAPIGTSTTTELPLKQTTTSNTIQNINLGFNVSAETLDINYYKNRAKNLLNTFKSTRIISKFSSVGGLEAYYVRDGIIFFGETSPAKIQNRYIATREQEQQKQFGPISIKLDINYIDSIVTNPPTGTKVKTEGEFYFDKLYEQVSRNQYTNQPYTRYGLSYSEFELIFENPKGAENKNTARTFYTNPNTEYYIDVIDAGPNASSTTPNSIQTLNIELSVKDNPEYKIYFNDLGIIQDIIGPQNLNYNAYLNERDAAIQKAEQDALAQRTQKQKEIEDEYNAEALRGTIDSESTIELMLRSLLLFGINNAINPNALKGKEYENFIKNLFSEGAYTPIFKKGLLDSKKYDDEFFKKYVNGTISSLERLEANLRYGNNFYLMSGENTYSNDSSGNFILKNQMTEDKIPQVDFTKLFKVLPVPYGKDASLETSKKPRISVYINLGLFFLMLNHTGLIYNKETLGKIKEGDVVTPMTYLDFNPETNFYLSSINQISLDPYKFIVPYLGTNKDYAALFDDSIEKNGIIRPVPPQKSTENQKVPVMAPVPLFDFENNDKLSGALPNQKSPKSGGSPNGYIGRLMYIMVDINYLLEEVIQNIKNKSDTNEAYFQTVIEKILTDLNKSMGSYNSFRLSYSDTGNCYVITDDQIQMRPDSQIETIHSKIVSENSTEYEIPIYGKKSIARSFTLNTDISSRLASLVAIASNPGLSDQVSNSKNTTDFGIYNPGSFDRYLGNKSSNPVSETDSASNLSAAQFAINFNSVVKSIYTYSRNEDNKEIQGPYISTDSINKAISYYTDKMAKIKNQQPESAHAMIIPLKSNITIDGMSGLYPFQLYTIDERILPYRYSSINLSSPVKDLRKVAFSISKITHTISDGQWVTSFDGFMTTLRNPSKQGQSYVREVKPTAVPVTEGNIFETINVEELPQNANTIYQYFISKGFSKEQAAGFVGNFWQESRLNPNAVNQKSGAIGIAQWLEPRKTQLLKKNNPYSLQTQLDFVWEELNSTEKNAYILIKASNTVEQSTYNIRKHFERPEESKANDTARLAIAKKILNNPSEKIA
jgi:hypothetical protein